MNCPNCNTTQEDAAAECVTCGLIFAKWQARQSAAASAPMAVSMPPAQAGASPSVVMLAALALAGYGGWHYWNAQAQGGGKPRRRGMDPEPYREEIAALENALYKEGPLGVLEVQAVEANAAAISGRLLQLKPPKTKSAAKMQEVAQRVGAASQALSFTSTARLEWTRAWEEARAQVFADAPWFHKPEAYDPDKPPMDLDFGIQQLQRFDHALSSLIAAAEGEMSQFGEKKINLANLKTQEDKLALTNWRTWVGGWMMRVDQAVQGMPDPMQLPQELWEAQRVLIRVTQGLRDPPDPGAGATLPPSDPEFANIYLPDKQSRDMWLGNLRDWLGDARKLMSSARSIPAKG